MKTKEIITKRILQHIGQMWEVKNINNLHPLVHLMIEAVSNELLLLDNKLEEMGVSVSDKLVEYFLPSTFNYVRPSHAILQVDPTVPVYELQNFTSFTFKEYPDTIRRTLSAISYTPVVSTIIHNIRISHLFYNRTLWATGENGRKAIGNSTKRAGYNCVWLGLHCNPEIEIIKNIPFYLDFKHLPDHHEYYDAMAELKWQINGEQLNVKSGFPNEYYKSAGKTEREILDFYTDHFQTITEAINLKDIPKRKIPVELADLLDESNFASPVPPLYWISIQFPANFKPDDLEKIDIQVNAVPIINRQYNERLVLKKDLSRVISLFSKSEQELLEIESITDSQNRTYQEDIELTGEYSYAVEPVRRKNVEDSRMIDYLERLADVIQEERSAFPDIDNEKIIQVLNTITDIRDKDTGRITHNRLKEFAEVALLTIKPGENTHSVKAGYWTTHGELLNGIPQNTILMASKVPELNKSDAILLTDTCGGRFFYTIKSLKAISNFYLSANDRVLTKHNILSFCKMEFSEYLEKADVVRKAEISHKLKEGIIIVMEIQITPKQQHIEFFRQKGVFKDFLIRLRKRSPNNFNYRIKLIE